MLDLGKTPPSLALTAVLTLSLTVLSPALGQDRGRDRWSVPDGATSENNEMLERMLLTFPDADTDNNGILDTEEGRAQIERFRQQWRERQEQRNQRRRGWEGESYRDIPYGEHDRNTLDIYVPTSSEPTPVVVYFHGGDFITGSKRDFGTLDARDLLGDGIAVASVEYRLVREAPFPASFDDATLALQYIRYHAEHFGIDPDRMVLHGEDAGANLALYLALHDDLAQTFTDEQRKDLERDARRALAREEPVGPRPGDDDEEGEEREPPPTWRNPGILETSTRVLAVTARHPLASFDPRYWREHDMPLYRHERRLPLYLDVQHLEPFDLPDLIELVGRISPVNLASADDPPVMLKSQYEELEIKEDTSWTVMAHHPIQIQKIAEALKSAGVDPAVHYDGIEGVRQMSDEAFLMRVLND
ncbi:MAG: alpha/beta hydrolase [Planctomycetota bacterium]